MPVYKNPDTGLTMALPEEVAALYPSYEKIADESKDEQEAREQREYIQAAVEAKVDVEVEDPPAGAHSAPVDENQDGV